MAGFTPSTAMRRAIGALTVGYYEDGELRYAGRVGTGYTTDVAHDLWRRLEKLQVDRAPVQVPAAEKRKNVHWVKPEMVIEAEFRGWTTDRLLRQASFKGVREDKPAREIVREEPAMAAKQAKESARKPLNVRCARPLRPSAPARARKRRSVMSA